MSRKKVVEEAKSIAVFLPNWIGDVVMATPVLKRLREAAGPNTRILGIMKPYVRDVLSGASWFDDCILYDAKRLGRLKASWRLVAALRRHRVDLALLLNSSLVTGMAAWLGGCRKIIGFPRNGRGAFLTQSVAEPARSSPDFYRSTVDQYAELAAAVGVEIPDRRLQLTTTVQDEAEAEAVFHALGWASPGGFIAINNGSAAGGAKSWPNAHFAELATRIASELGRKVLVLCGPAEKKLAAEIVEMAKSSAVQAYLDSNISLGASKALIRRASAMVTTDSGPRHIAAAFQVPSVVLFGPTPPELSRNYFDGAFPLQLALECAPCFARECPLGHHRCMKDLSPKQVFRQLEIVMQGASLLSREAA